MLLAQFVRTVLMAWPTISTSQHTVLTFPSTELGVPSLLQKGHEISKLQLGDEFAAPTQVFVVMGPWFGLW